MSTASKSDILKGGPADAALAIVAVLGFWAFVFVLPSYHIDGLAEYGLAESEAIDRANIYLTSQGFNVEGLEKTARLTRNDRLLNAMQKDLGRQRTIEILSQEANGPLPAFLWLVSYNLANPESSVSFAGSTGAQVFNVYLSMDGEVVAFTNTAAEAGAAASGLGSASRSVNRSLLSRLLTESDSSAAAGLTRLRAVSDSLIISNLHFAQMDEDEFGNSPSDTEGRDRVLDLESGRKVALDSLDVLSMATLHAPNQGADGVEWVVDSLRVLPGDPANLATVRLKTVEPIHGQTLRVDMTMSSTGNLREMNVVTNPDREENTVVEDVLGVVAVGGYALLAVIFIVLFIRRIMARLIDVKGSMLDALLLGVLFGLYVILQRELGFQSATSGMGRIGVTMLVFSVTGGAVALFVFILSAATESITREVLPRKIHSSMLVRRWDLHNKLVGWSLLRGVGVAGVLLGIGVLALVLMPNLALSIDTTFATQESFRPFVSAGALSLSSSYIMLVILLLGIGTFFYRISSRPVVVVASVTVAGAVLQIDPFGLAAGWAAVMVSTIIALVIALVYMRYDFLTALVALTVTGFAWRLSEGFLIDQSPVWLDTLLATMLIITVAVFGGVGVLSRRTGGDADQYVPHYITELAGQERIKRELEIAYQVQASFLPRTMPDVNGLDIAGMCLPANEIGGDYYDFIRLSDGRLAFVVGDVSGKGIQAAFYMTLVKGVIQTLSTTLDSPCMVMRRLNEVFRRNAPAGTFISAIYGVVDPHTGAFTFARAGHNPAILKRADSATPEFLRPTGMAIGFTDGRLFEESITEVSIDLKPGDALVFYTDGFSEAMNSKRELYGDDRLLKKVGQVGLRSASGILRSLTEDVHHFIEAAGRSDDMTMVVVKRSQVP